MEDYSMFIPKVHFEQIPIKHLVSNQEYQRSISMAHVLRTASDFDLYQINPIKVSRRDGINYVFNGQHTVEIIAEVAGTREVPVWCMIYDDLDYVSEADVFAKQQKYVKALSPYEIFAANIEAGNDMQLIIRDLVASYGLSISDQKRAGHICAIATIEDIYRKYGFHVLDRTLRLCIATWEGDVNSLSSNILRGIAFLIVTYGDDLDDTIFKEKLGEYSPKNITRTAKDRRMGSMGFAETMLDFYNKKMKYKLRWKKLYEKTNDQPKPMLPNPTDENIVNNNSLEEEPDME